MTGSSATVISTDELQIRRLLKYGTPLSAQEREDALSRIEAAVRRLDELALPGADPLIDGVDLRGLINAAAACSALAGRFGQDPPDARSEDELP